MNREENVRRLREKFKKGTRIKLIEMFNEPQMSHGLIGTVSYVDDVGQVHVNWSNGSTLALNVDLDNFEIYDKKNYKDE